MKIKFLPENTLILLKENIDYNVEKYRLEDNDWICKFTETTNPFAQSNIEFIFSELNPNDSEITNIKKLFLSLKHLTRSQASDERLWAGLSHDFFWKFMIKRWDLNRNKRGEMIQYIKKNYFFAHGKTRSLMTNGLARYWWIAKLTFNENLNDPFTLTEYISKDINGRGFPLFGSNFSNNKNVLFPFLFHLKKYEDSNPNLSREQFLELIKEMNLYGGKYLLDTLNEEKIRTILDNKLKEISYKEHSNVN